MTVTASRARLPSTTDSQQDKLSLRRDDVFDYAETGRAATVPPAACGGTT